MSRKITKVEKRLIPVIAVVVFVGAIVWIGSWLWSASGIPAAIQADKERNAWVAEMEANERSPKVALERLTAKNRAAEEQKRIDVEYNKKCPRMQELLDIRKIRRLTEAEQLEAKKLVREMDELKPLGWGLKEADWSVVEKDQRMRADLRERKERAVQGYLRLMKAGLMNENDSNEMHSLQMELKADDLKK